MIERREGDVWNGRWWQVSYRALKGTWEVLENWSTTVMVGLPTKQDAIRAAHRLATDQFRQIEKRRRSGR